MTFRFSVSIELSSSGRFSALRDHLKAKCRQLRVQKPLLISRPFSRLPTGSCNLPPPYNPSPPLRPPELPLMLPSSGVGRDDAWYEAITTATGHGDLMDIYLNDHGGEAAASVNPCRVKEVEERHNEPDSSLNRRIPYIVVDDCSLHHAPAEMRDDSLRPPASVERRFHQSWF